MTADEEQLLALALRVVNHEPRSVRQLRRFIWDIAWSDHTFDRLIRDCFFRYEQMPAHTRLEILKHQPAYGRALAAYLLFR